MRCWGGGGFELGLNVLVDEKPSGLIANSTSTRSSNLERFGRRSSGGGDGGNTQSSHGSPTSLS
jgi:hypothetical protein